MLHCDIFTINCPLISLSTLSDPFLSPTTHLTIFVVLFFVAH